MTRLVLALVLGLTSLGLLVARWSPPAVSADATSDQATTYNCDGTSWAFRALRLANGHVGFQYGVAHPGGDRTQVAFSDPVDIGGNVAALADVSTACIVGRVWVFARFAAPVDGSARLYERHGLVEDLANGYGGGFADGWYHWR